MLRIPGTCSACPFYRDGVCAKSGSQFNGQRMFSCACVECGWDGRSQPHEQQARREGCN
jgi:hypothetical protein